MTDLIPVRRALISVSNKKGLVDLAMALTAGGIEICSTGGSAKVMKNAGIPVKDVATITNFPEMMDGRLKTLHPNVHGGLLALRNNPGHLASMKEHGISGIDLLIVNLYPFEDTVVEGGDYHACIENIDIGGPAMIRAGAKNNAFVTTIVDIDDYAELIAELSNFESCTRLAFRQKMAHRAYARTAAYDAVVSQWFANNLNDNKPRRVTFSGKLAQELRYGENPHQRASFYVDGSGRAGVANAIQHQGKELSYNNINDTDAAFELASEFGSKSGPACAIIKHANPCGVARGKTLLEAYCRAYDCDRTSAFGGIIAFNQALDEETAHMITKIFTEVVIAPDATGQAIKAFSKKPNLRLLTTGEMADPTRADQMIRQVSGGFLLQEKDSVHLDFKKLNVVTKRQPSEIEMTDMIFAWTVAKHVKSNAIIYVKNRATVGVGAGQMSRVDSCRIAARKSLDMAEQLKLSHPLTQGSVVASDAFFPFADGLLTVAAAGATAVIQPGGSMKDDEIIASADEAGLAMVFTGTRHFRH